MKRLWLVLSVCLLGAVAARPAFGDDLRPGIIGKDDRTPVGATGWPWDAIGQVNIAGYRTQGKCTGTLIAPDLVLTAAHCVMDRFKKTPFPLHSIHFLAGVRRQENKGHSTAKCLRFLESYQFIGPEPGSSRTVLKVPRAALLKDAAVIVLNEPLKVLPALLGDDALAPPGTELMHVSYPADRRFVLSAQRNCQHLPSAAGDALWATDCDTHPASSGGPIFTQEGGALKLVAVMVATGGGEANLALPVSVWRELAGTTGCP